MGDEKWEGRVRESADGLKTRRPGEARLNEAKTHDTQLGREQIQTAYEREKGDRGDDS